MRSFKYPGRELNPHDHHWPQDFKSCVSTNSTTRAEGFYFSNFKQEPEKKGLPKLDALIWSGRRDSDPRP